MHSLETIEEIETSVQLLKAVPDQWKPDARASGNFALLLYTFIEGEGLPRPEPPTRFQHTPTILSGGPYRRTSADPLGNSGCGDFAGISNARSCIVGHLVATDVR